MRLSRTLLSYARASEVLTLYLQQAKEPPWTSFFMRMIDVTDDQFGQTNFNWTLKSGTNYHILRSGCFPYIKYHCTKADYQDLTIDDMFFRLLKIINLGIPLLLYGLSAMMFIRHKEYVSLPNGKKVPIFFLYKEDTGARY